MSVRRAAISFLLTLIAVSSVAAQTPDAGRQVFVARCAGCHGSDGNGGELGPGIATRVPLRSDADLATLLRQGLPGAGMPVVRHAHRAGIGGCRALPAHAAAARRLRARAREGDARRRPDARGTRPQPQRERHAAARRRSDAAPASQERQHLPAGHVADRLDELQRPGRAAAATARSRRSRKATPRSSRPKWIFSLPNTAPLQVTPVVAGGVMYVTSANECYALDAGTGRQIWRYQRPRTKGLIGNAAGGANRGVSVAGDQRLHGDGSRAPDRARPHRPARCAGTPRWPTGTRTTTRPALRCRSATSSSPARPAATKACADSWPRSIRRPARKCGASGRCRSAASRDRKPGREKASTIPAARRG